MTAFYIFLAFMIGGMLGAGVMALLQAGKDNDNDDITM